MLKPVLACFGVMAVLFATGVADKMDGALMGGVMILVFGLVRGATSGNPRAASRAQPGLSPPAVPHRSPKWLTPVLLSILGVLLVLFYALARSNRH
jgi:hypothetical protein